MAEGESQKREGSRLKGWVLASVFVFSAPAAAQVTPAQAVDEVLAIAVPPTVVIDAAVQSFGKAFQEKTAPSLNSVERLRPGVTAYTRSAAEAEIRRSMQEGMPALLAELRRIYLNGLTQADIAALYAFYRSPTGRKMAQAALTGVTTQVLKDVGRADYTSLRTNAQNAAVSRELEGLGSGDTATLVTFARSGVAEKLPAMQAQQQQAMQDWMASLAGSTGARVNTAMNAALARYTARTVAVGRKHP